ncbi:S24 family peptidase [Hymenobacter sediminicola]|uniref:LexA family transcriptional regulator n=1 Tax=Hymenobacter sediminicola TaxID=2761579 RepID=A0A7G7W2X2_9BACT|nr:LexA family transcriptional regulator [Hymenobacter sediminicola]QNH60715.1 LexA family transcriptional regulator [Hymenobacter sediminicola]
MRESAEQQTIHQRITELIDRFEQGNKSAFGRRADISSGVLGDLVGGRLNKPSFDVLAKILRAYPLVHAEWLLLGSGPMLRDGGKEAPERVLHIDEPENMLHPTIVRQLQPDPPIIPRPIGVPMVTVDTDRQENISLVSSKVAASYPTRYLEPEFYKDLPAFSIPLPEFRNATFRAFQVVGDSMSPTFYPGGWVLARFVDFTRETLQEGYIHVVVTRENLVVKRVLDRIEQRNTLALQSDNEEFQTYEVQIEDVQEVWRVVADIGFKFPNVRFDTRRRLSGLEADLQNLMARLEKVEKRSTPE